MNYFIRKKKKKGSILAMLFIILPLLMLSTLSGADPLFTFCSPDRNYTADGQFENNLKLLLDSLSSNISRNDSLSGFYNTSVGDNPYRVYGQALCRLDVSAEVCQSCIQNANQNILKSCSMSADAMIWYELCQVRYSFQMFFSLMVYTGKFPPQNDQERNISKPDQFNKVMKYLMKNLTSETAMNPSKNMFATGEIKFSKSIKIYGLSQCTRDMSKDNCYSCFQFALTELYKCCSSREGGIVVSRNCNLRFQLYRFYNDTSSSLLIYPSKGGGKWKTWEVLLVCGVALILAIFIGSFVVYIFWRKKRGDISENALLDELASPRTVTVTQDGTLVTSDEFPFMDLASIRVATNDFADSNKLGQGGFGVVYKGVLPDHKEVAVKRLSRKSWQGLEELRNEVILIAKLQHRNLVRLLGYAIEGDEKLLLYEFMPNRSLDTFIYDSERRSQLNWETYYNIIGGIARGLLYLHEDSRLKIIHRDLKPNVSGWFQNDILSKQPR
ncbi:hypothetical protein UlMin_011411, partial [Ulmus minor]